jgi:protocatechuate 3,4-dioxygenase beta subunit
MLPLVTRRHALRTLLYGAGGTLAVASQARAGEAATTPAVLSAATQPDGACTLFPEAVEGPFYFDPKLVRQDITEGRSGAAMDLVLQVIEAGPCKPITNARVDVWHTDARGVYSGYDRQGDQGNQSTEGKTFLRGTQITDANGRVTFQTIVPGWYPGRTPHVHVKVFLDEKTAATGQVYFPDDLIARVYKGSAPYTARPEADTTNATDFIFRSSAREGGGIVLAVAETPERLTASLVIAVDKSGRLERRTEGWGGWLKSWWPAQ